MFMGRLDRFQSLLIFAAVAVGLLLGRWPAVETVALPLVTPFLMALVFGIFAQVSTVELRRAFSDVRLTYAALAVNFLWTPLLAWVLGALFLRSHPDLWVGLIMLLVTPCTDWYLMFTAMALGDLAFSTAILPVNLVLQLLLLPVYLLLLGGTVVEIQLESLGESIVLVLAIPLVAAVAMRTILGRLPDPRKREQ